MGALRNLNTSIEIYRNRKAMGEAAGRKAEERILARLKEKKEIRLIAGAAPSQNEILKYLAESTLIDWSRVIAFHMDEYVGLPADAPQGFGNFLRERLFNKVSFKKVHYLNGNAEPEEECKRYAGLLKQKPIDVVLCGIGENGHLAFNDPPSADFADPLTVKVVNLDSVCRNQQVHDGCFSSLKLVPKQALTLTIPILLSTASVICTVPGAAKAAAAERMVKGPVSVKCPASILRFHRECSIFLDNESGKGLLSTISP
jgi:glucosamine-6-phosphate deaminase